MSHCLLLLLPSNSVLVKSVGVEAFLPLQFAIRVKVKYRREQTTTTTSVTPTVHCFAPFHSHLPRADLVPHLLIHSHGHSHSFAHSFATACHCRISPSLFSFSLILFPFSLSLVHSFTFACTFACLPVQLNWY